MSSDYNGIRLFESEKIKIPGKSPTTWKLTRLLNNCQRRNLYGN